MEKVLHEMKLEVTVKEIKDECLGRVVREVSVDAKDITPECLAAAIDVLIYRFQHIYCKEGDEQ